MASYVEGLGRSGYVWLRGALSEDQLGVLEAVFDGPGARHAVGARVPWVAMVVDALRAAAPCLIGAHRAVRIVAFDKSKRQNWAIPWHQDRVIAVASRAACPGFRNWTNKAGIWHCEPPVALLKRMLFVRVHIDDCDSSNGAMSIAEGSHAAGLVRGQDGAEVASRYMDVSCDARRGDVQVLDMLTLHRSPAAVDGMQRRALRIDLADFDLPAPLNWA